MIVSDNYEQILTFLASTIYPNSGELNFIDGMVGDSSILPTVQSAMSELQIRYDVIQYDGDMETFISNLYTVIHNDRPIFILLNTHFISRDFYYFINNIRNFNRLEYPVTTDKKKYSLSPLPANSRIYFIFQKDYIKNINVTINTFTDSVIEIK